MGIFDLFKKPVDIEYLINSRDQAGLKDALKDSDPSIQIQAASALAGYGQWEGLAFLNSCLHHSKDSIRLAAIEALGDCCDDRAVESLIPLLKVDQAETRETAAAALSHYDTPAALAALQAYNSSTTVAEPAESDGSSDLNLTPTDPIMGVNPYSPPIEGQAFHTAIDRTARELYILAESHEEEGRYTQANDEINQVISRAPGWADAYNLRGIILEDLEKPFPAMLSYQWAVHLDPSHQAAANNLAELIRENEVLTSSLDEWLNSPPDRDDWKSRVDAVCALNQRPEPEALQAVVSALQDSDPEVASTALEALQANPHPDARKALMEYFGSQTGEDGDLIAPGEEGFFSPELQISGGEIVESTSDVLVGAITIPEPMRLDDCLKAADYYCENEEYDRAFLLVRYADLLDPGNPDVQNQRGIIHECRKEFMQANFSYRRAIELDPGFREARKNLEELEQEFGAPLKDSMILMSDLEDSDEDLVLRAVVTLGEMGLEDAAGYIQPLIEGENLHIAVAAAVALSQINRQTYQESIRFVYNRLGELSLTQALTTQPDKAIQLSTTITADRAELLRLLFSPAHPEWMLAAAQREFDRIAMLDQELCKQGITVMQEIRDLFFHVVYMEIYRRFNPDMFVDRFEQLDGRVREIDVVLVRVFEGWLSDPATAISNQILTAWAALPDLVSGETLIYSMKQVRSLAAARLK